MSGEREVVAVDPSCPEGVDAVLWGQLQEKLAEYAEIAASPTSHAPEEEEALRAKIVVLQSEVALQEALQACSENPFKEGLKTLGRDTAR
jgi:hypothetical protein